MINRCDNEKVKAYFKERWEHAQQDLKPGDIVRLCVSEIGAEPWGDPVFSEVNSKLGKVYWMNGNPPGGLVQLASEEIRWRPGTLALVISTAGVYYKKSATAKLDRRNNPAARIIVLVNEKLCDVGAENIGPVISQK